MTPEVSRLDSFSTIRGTRGKWPKCQMCLPRQKVLSQLLLQDCQHTHRDVCSLVQSSSVVAVTWKSLKREKLPETKPEFDQKSATNSSNTRATPLKLQGNDTHLKNDNTRILD